MAKEITSKNIDGITDLVVIAPIKDGLVDAADSISYASRLRIVAEALNGLRVAARQFEVITPFSDVTERILTLLDFRIGIIDKDLFAIKTPRNSNGNSSGLQSKRYLYLTATFDGAWEPYMRLIWDPLGPFLDLLFCNCEGYVTAGDHSFPEYAQWVRDNQMDSGTFYATTALTVRDQLYLNRHELLVRSMTPSHETDLMLARMQTPNPEHAAKRERDDAFAQLLKGQPDKYRKIHELAFEALTVLYKLADYFPPEWLIKSKRLYEGKYLARVAHNLLEGWEELVPTQPGPLLTAWKALTLGNFRSLWNWFETGGNYLKEIERKALDAKPKDPLFEVTQVQDGILKAHGSRANPVKHGALLLISITNAEHARKFLKTLPISYAPDPSKERNNGTADDQFITIGFTVQGLRRMGLSQATIDHFPKEFREGMELRAGLMGDMRENQPRNWRLPTRNWPILPSDSDDFAKSRPPVEMSEVDLVLKIKSTNPDPANLEKLVTELSEGGKDGLQVLSVERMSTNYSDGPAHFTDHFGFRDGISQPKPIVSYQPTNARQPDEVALGEVVLGYRNDRDDFAHEPFASLEFWRRQNQTKANELLDNGTFLVIRKLEQHVATFEEFVENETKEINIRHPSLNPPMTEDRLKAKILGRWPDGTPLVPATDGSLNNFDYETDVTGDQCPFASHVRRTNPRDSFQGRNAPRIVRRGMLFGDGNGSGPKGLMFMAYNASIAEQFETIQRWINGGNSTGIASGHADPLLGVAPKTSVDCPASRVFRFVENNEVIRVTMPEAFVSLHWGQYLFIPSRAAISQLCALKQGYRVMDEALESNGRAVIERLQRIGNIEEEGKEWKRLLEDYDVKDPAERDISPDMWSAVRFYYSGAIRIPKMPTLTGKSMPNWQRPPDIITQDIILCASYKQVMGVLKDWRNFSTEEQLRRVAPNSGPIYVAQQPDNIYKAKALQGKYDYEKEALANNEILMKYDKKWGFLDGYKAGLEVITEAKILTAKSGRHYFKLELRRQYLLPALGKLCKLWFGVPDGTHMIEDGWDWRAPKDRDPAGPHCPGDFLAPSRNAFYPRPRPLATDFADVQGKAALAGCQRYINQHRKNGAFSGQGSILTQMAQAIPDNKILARNLTGMMIGAIPPMDGNLRGVVTEWLGEKTLWRHQASLRRALKDQTADKDPEAAIDVLYGPISQAMCKRPAPDLLYRTALNDTELNLGGGKKLAVQERDLLIVSLVSASQRSLKDKPETGDVSIVFGGKREKADQRHVKGQNKTVHACPAQDLAMGAMMGIMAALLDAGSIQALPASLIVKVKDYPLPALPPAV